MIYFDLDGVLRDIHRAANWTPQFWSEKIDGQDVIAYFASHPNLLRHAPVTEYFQPIVDFVDELHILSAQPASWLNPTLLWIQDNIKTKFKLTITGHTNKLKALGKDDLLIEDNPTLPSYSKVIVVDRSYNRSITSPHIRVHTPEQLISTLRSRQHDTSKT